MKKYLLDAIPLYFVLCLMLFSNPSVFGQEKKSDTTQLDLSLKGGVVEQKSFNQGHITNPLQLFQAKSSSLMITRGGNDPNGRVDMQIRGLQSLDITEPLILVDGIPLKTLEGIHPSDIASVEVIKDGAALAMYGIRGSNGVLSIRTKRGEDGKLQINYRSYIATEGLLNKPKVLDAQTYDRRGGWNIGGQTDWWDEISQRGVSQTHHISLSNGTEKSSYYASLNYDDVNGVIKRSGFNRLSGRFSFEQKAMKDRLIVRGGLSGILRRSNYILPDVMEQATNFPPTAPITSNEPGYEEFGGYFELRTFKQYNPVALLRQPDLNSSYQNIFFNLDTELKITPALSARFRFGEESEGWDNNTFFPRTSFYMNFGRSKRGYAGKKTVKLNNRFTNLGLEYEKQWNKFGLGASFSYRYQDMDRAGISAGARDVFSDALSYNNLSAVDDFARGEGQVDSYHMRHEIEGYYGNLSMNLNDRLYLNASASYEGSSWLGSNSKRGLFYGIDVGAQINKKLRLRSAFSKTGNLPARGGLTQTIYEPYYFNFYYNGRFQSTIEKSQIANPDLQWEETTSWSIGADFELMAGRLRGSLDLYNYQSDQLITRAQSFTSGAGYTDFYGNEGSIKGGGIEYALNYSFANKKNFSWDMGIFGTKYFKTILLDYVFEEDDEYTVVGRLGGICPFPIFRLEAGQPLGQIWGLRLNQAFPVSQDGYWNIIDVDRDGRVDDIKDKEILGNAMPKFSLGFNNHMEWNDWTIDFQLRGIFGHDMINHIQSFNSAPIRISYYNILESGLDELEGLTDMPEFTDRDVQKGSYLRMTHITFGYDMPLEKLKGVQNLHLFLSAQNLFTITGYTGLDPELRMEDRWRPYWDHAPIAQDDIGDPRVLGMERVGSYPNSRVFSLGVRINL